MSNEITLPPRLFFLSSHWDITIYNIEFYISSENDKILQNAEFLIFQEVYWKPFYGTQVRAYKK